MSGMESFATGFVASNLLALLALALGLVILLAVAFGGGERKRLNRRLKRLRDRRAGDEPDLEMPKVTRSNADSDIPAIDRLIKRLVPRREELRKRLMRAGLGVSLQRYLVFGLLTGLAAFLACLGLGLPLAGSVALGVAATLGLPHAYVGWLASRRRKRFLAYFAEAIDLITRGLKSGLPIGESIKAAGDEIADPVGSELRQVMDAVRLGSKLEDALWEAAERLELQEFKFFAISLVVQSETGGNLAETLANLSDVIRGRRHLKMKIKALSSEAKASAYIIGSLPFVMATVIYLMSPDYIMALVYDVRGNIMIAGGLVSFLIGTGVMTKMVRFDV